jgi:hypothetical protein
MKVTIAKRNGLEEVHKAGCRDLKNRRGRGWASDREDWSMEATTLADVYRSYWDCIAEENVGEGNYATIEDAWWAWRGEFKVLPCADIPEMAEPGSVEPAKPSRSEAKADLARRMVLAVEAMLDGSDESDAFRAGMSFEEAAQMAANWLAHLPAGKDGDARWWSQNLPRPTAKRGWS